MSVYKIKDLAIEISERVNNPKDSGYDKFVGLEHYDSGNVRITRYGDASKMQSSAKAIKNGDVLIARRNVYLKRAGLVSFDGLTSGDSIVLRAKNETIRSILPFIFNTDKFWKYANKFSDGSMSKRLSPKILMEYEANLPENNTDIEKLSCLLWSISDTLDSYNDMLKVCDELVKGQFIEMFGDPVRNNRKWETQKISVVAPEYSPKIEKRDKYWWLNLDAIENNTGKVLKKEIVPICQIGSSTSTFNATMVLYSKLRPYLNKVVVPDGEGYATTELVGLKPNVKVLNKVFLLNLFLGNEFVEYASKIAGGSQMPRMPMNVLRNFDCIIPPIKLQDEFAEFYKHLDKSKVALKDTIKSLNKIYTSIVNTNLG